MTEPTNVVPSLPGENARWYARLLSFIALNRGRSILKVYNQEREQAGKSAAQTIPGNWQTAITRFQWRERAETFDRRELERDAETFRATIDQERRRRFELLKRTRRKLAVALKNLNPAGMSWKEFSAVFRAVFDEALAFDPPGGGATTGTLTPEDFVRRCQDAAGRMLTFDPGGEGR